MVIVFNVKCTILIQTIADRMTVLKNSQMPILAYNFY